MPAAGRACSRSRASLTKRAGDAFPEDVVGIVEAWGRIELHADGFRAQFARPHTLALIGPSRDSDVGSMIVRLARRYGAELVELESAEELAEYCRERSLGLDPATVRSLVPDDPPADVPAPARPAGPRPQGSPSRPPLAEKLGTIAMVVVGGALVRGDRRLRRRDRGWGDPRDRRAVSGRVPLTPPADRRPGPGRGRRQASLRRRRPQHESEAGCAGGVPRRLGARSIRRADRPVGRAGADRDQAEPAARRDRADRRRAATAPHGRPAGAAALQGRDPGSEGSGERGRRSAAALEPRVVRPRPLPSRGHCRCLASAARRRRRHGRPRPRRRDQRRWHPVRRSARAREIARGGVRRAQDRIARRGGSAPSSIRSCCRCTWRSRERRRCGRRAQNGDVVVRRVVRRRDPVTARELGQQLRGIGLVVTARGELERALDRPSPPRRVSPIAAAALPSQHQFQLPYGASSA